MKNFEERLSNLEEINTKLHSQDISLEEALKAYEEGIQLVRTLEKDLNKIEAKVQILTNEPVKNNEPPELDLFSSLNN